MDILNICFSHVITVFLKAGKHELTRNLTQRHTVHTLHCASDLQRSIAHFIKMFLCKNVYVYIFLHSCKTYFITLVYFIRVIYCFCLTWVKCFLILLLVAKGKHFSVRKCRNLLQLKKKATEITSLFTKSLFTQH